MTMMTTAAAAEAKVAGDGSSDGVDRSSDMKGSVEDHRPVRPVECTKHRVRANAMNGGGRRVLTETYRQRQCLFTTLLVI